VTTPQLPQKPDTAPLTEQALLRDPMLLIDRYLPRYDFAIVHASVLPARPEECYRAARGVDLLRDPVIRTLLGLRSLPQHLANRLAGRHRSVGTTTEPPRTFRLDDMVRYDWVLLGEEPNVEIVFGQIGRPWKPVDASSGPPVAPAAFASFDRPGFAKIAFNIRVEPYGASSSILTAETRVALTDPQSLRRFARYWTLIGPFSALIRRIALRLIAADLRRAGHP
jgi:hypothetical protein